MTKNPGGGGQIVKSYQLMRRLAHYVVNNISIIVVIVLSNEMIFDIILMWIWHTISSLKLYFKRGQGCLHYIPLLLGNRSFHVIYQKVTKYQKIDNISLYTRKPFLEIPNVKEITDGFALLLGSPSYLTVFTLASVCLLPHWQVYESTVKALASICLY